MNCECQIAFGDGDNPHQRIEGMHIEFCPLHEMAPEMVEVLESTATELEGYLRVIGPGYPSYRSLDAMLTKIRALLAKVKEG